MCHMCSSTVHHNTDKQAHLDGYIHGWHVEGLKHDLRTRRGEAHVSACVNACACVVRTHVLCVCLSLLCAAVTVAQHVMCVCVCGLCVRAQTCECVHKHTCHVLQPPLTCVIFSLLPLGFSGASVSSTGCSCVWGVGVCMFSRALVCTHRSTLRPPAVPASPCPASPLTSGATRSSLKKVWCQIFSMSSQLDTTPCSMGWRRDRIPRLDCASSPTYESCAWAGVSRRVWLGVAGCQACGWAVRERERGRQTGLPAALDLCE